MLLQGVPVWMAALLLAAFAPWAARLLEREVTRRVRARTAMVLARVGTENAKTKRVAPFDARK